MDEVFASLGESQQPVVAVEDEGQERQPEVTPEQAASILARPHFSIRYGQQVIQSTSSHSREYSDLCD